MNTTEPLPAPRFQFRNTTRFLGLVIRELAGWALLGCALYVFRQCFDFLNRTPSQLIEAALVALMGISLFRGGLQLIKVSVAARAYERAEPR